MANPVCGGLFIRTTPLTFLGFDFPQEFGASFSANAFDFPFELALMLWRPHQRACELCAHCLRVRLLPVWSRHGAGQGARADEGTSRLSSLGERRRNGLRRPSPVARRCLTVVVGLESLRSAGPGPEGSG